MPGFHELSGPWGAARATTAAAFDLRELPRYSINDCLPGQRTLHFNGRYYEAGGGPVEPFYRHALSGFRLIDEGRPSEALVELEASAKEHPPLLRFAESGIDIPDGDFLWPFPFWRIYLQRTFLFESGRPALESALGELDTLKLVLVSRIYLQAKLGKKISDVGELGRIDSLDSYSALRVEDWLSNPSQAAELRAFSHRLLLQHRDPPPNYSLSELILERKRPS
jgi:hypothetical protein